MYLLTVFIIWRTNALLKFTAFLNVLPVFLSQAKVRELNLAAHCLLVLVGARALSSFISRLMAYKKMPRKSGESVNGFREKKMTDDQLYGSVLFNYTSMVVWLGEDTVTLFIHSIDLAARRLNLT
jgi:hypothetical protein